MAPTSATGSSGFSLVELLVVLVVLGLLGTSVLLTVPSTREGVHAPAEQLAAHLLRAREEALLGNRATAVRVDAHGWRFEQRGWDGWQALATPPLQPRSFPESVAPELPAPDAAVRFAFDATGGATPAELRLRGPDASLRLELSANGEVALHALR